MLFFDGALGLLLLGLWIFCIIDVVTTPEDQCRNLPKLAWLLVVLLFFDVGSIVWLVAGRNWNRQPSAPHQGNGRRGASRTARASNPDDDEDFQAQLRERVAEQRRRSQESHPDDDRPATT